MELSERRKQCEELIGPLRRMKQQEERAAKKLIVSRGDRWCLRNSHRITAVSLLIVGFLGFGQSWKAGLTMMVANQRVLLHEGTFGLASGVFFVIAALWSWWVYPAMVNRQRLLLLLAEDFLERNKEPGPTPEPTSAPGVLGTGTT